MLELKNLTVKRGDLTVADHINVRFEEGKVYTVLGPNGTGKSSMLKTIFGELPHEGMITYQGKQLERTKLADWRKPIGYMPQDSRVDASLTALEVVLLGRMDSLTMRVSDELLTEAASIMAQLGIGHLAHRDILNLSGGQRQMVMFAQVLLREPQILMLDEPVSALDMHHQLNLLDEVYTYTKQKNLLTILVLHDLSLAAQFSDELILLGEDKEQGVGDAHHVLQVETINRLYHVNVELLQCSAGLQWFVHNVNQHILKKEMKMKKIVLAALVGLSFTAQAAHYDIKMLNSNSEGSMVFEPGYLKVQPGDTVTFRPENKSHFVHSKAIPEGAQKFQSEEDQELTITLDKEGVYVYSCPVHRSMNMNGVIQVGDNLPNKEQAEKVVKDLEKKSMTNKGRLEKYFAQVK